VRGEVEVDRVAHLKGVLFEFRTPLGFDVRVTRERWELITVVKHPVMLGREDRVRLALEAPDEVWRSRKDDAVLLFYKAEAPKRWTCAVVKQSETGAFLLTAYPSEVIKEGTRIWPT
jgi:hypothetical protein